MNTIKKIILLIIVASMWCVLSGMAVYYYEIYNTDYILDIRGKNKDGDIRIKGFNDGMAKENLIFYPTIEYQKEPDGESYFGYIESIEYFAFENEYIIKSVEFKDESLSKIQWIYCSPFSNCVNLASINVPISVQLIEGFENCIELKEINLLGVEQINDFAFSGCKQLNKVIIGNKIRYIASYAFMNCQEGLEVTINAIIPPFINENVFFGLTDYTINVPKVTLDLYKASKSWIPYLEHLKAFG